MTVLVDLEYASVNPNVKAFLMAIRLGEGTLSPEGYNMIVGGGIFTDMSTHPDRLVLLSKLRIYSTAAGAYQIIYPTYLGLCSQYGFSDFEPATQDLMAIALIYERNAIADIEAGNLQSAIAKCAVEWASLPGSTAGQRTEAYVAVENCYLANGGILSA